MPSITEYNGNKQIRRDVKRLRVTSFIYWNAIASSTRDLIISYYNKLSQKWVTPAIDNCRAANVLYREKLTPCLKTNFIWVSRIATIVCKYCNM